MSKKDKLKLYKQVWRERHPQKVREENRKYRENNSEKIKEYAKKYREKKKAQKLTLTVSPKQQLTAEERKAKRREAKKKHYAKYPGKLAAEKKKRYDRLKNTPEFKITRNLRKRLKKVLKKKTQLGDFVNLIGCSVTELKLHLESQFQEGMNWDNYGEWHIDHIKPICAFNLNDALEVARINHYTNLRPLWKEENCAKAARDVKLKYKP